MRYLRDKVLLILISSPSSRSHLTVGRGDPVAWQFSVTFEFSRTMASELLIESSILGGTENKRESRRMFLINQNSTPAESRNTFTKNSSEQVKSNLKGRTQQLLWWLRRALCWIIYLLYGVIRVSFPILDLLWKESGFISIWETTIPV